MAQHVWNTVGLMSGTSLDGLDIASVRFSYREDDWQYEIGEAETVPYPSEWAERLRHCMGVSASALRKMDLELGTYFGEQAAHFIDRHGLKVDLVASHGHTVFHQPEAGMTLQIGDGQALREACGHTVVCDFRTGDVLKGGQGAPLVPIGDLLLFPEHRYCLNIGGIANISIKKGEGAIIAADLCFANMALNHLAQEGGKEYDDGGAMAAAGKADPSLLSSLERLAPSKETAFSLGREGFETGFLPLISNRAISLEYRLCTCCEHIARAVARAVHAHGRDGDAKERLLVTGGGAFNTYLVSRIRHHLGGRCEVELPEQRLIAFKEAMVFAFLGVLRLNGQHNVLASVTGAKRDSCSGAVHPVL